ncbi:MAG: hypothetical protein AVDCRST_MAG33-3428, partial [uncultured Thermomicrobiales bacterium]
AGGSLRHPDDPDAALARPPVGRRCFRSPTGHGGFAGRYTRDRDGPGSRYHRSVSPSM